MENSIEENIKEIECFFKRNYFVNYDWTTIHRNSMANLEDSIEHILSDYKRVLKENETYKKQYFCLIDKIENKIDKFDYEFEKAKRKNYQERADYYWDLIRNFKKLLEEEK